MRAKLYKSRLSETEFRERLSLMVQVHSNDRIRQHLKKYNTGMGGRIYGTIGEDEFRIWQQGVLSGGIFYPVFMGKFLQYNNELQLDLNSQPNKMGNFIFLGISLVLGLGLVLWALFFSQEYQILNSRWITGLLGLGLFLFFQIVPNVTYTKSKRGFRRFLEAELELERIN